MNTIPIVPAQGTSHLSSTRARDPALKGKLEVRLPQRPRDYVSGSGPPLEPLSLLPIHDSTAYILERILLPSPGPGRNGQPMPKRMTYIVGWTDLPAATLLVPAMKVLDYVSPRALEDWEDKMEAELDKERARIAEEKSSARLAAAAPNQAQVVRKGRKKKGRPPVHSKIEAAAVMVPGGEEEAKAHVLKGAMSMTTPTKAGQRRQFRDLSDDEESVTKQLQREMLQLSSTAQSDAEEEENEGEDEDEDVNMVDLPTRYDDESLSGFVTDNVTNGTPKSITYTHHDIPMPDPVNRASASSRPPAAYRLPATETTSSLLPPNRVTGKLVQQTLRFSPADKAPAESNTHYPLMTGSDPSNHMSNGSTQAQTADPSSAPEPLGAPDGSESEEEAWVVKRLENDAYFEDEEGNVAHLYLVRWEGDWPPDQNPTWEPEENIDPGMIRNYKKRGKTRRKKGMPREKKLGAAKKPSQAKTSKKRPSLYASVSEAFVGETDELQMDDGDYRRDNVADDDMHEEMFIVDKQQVAPKMSWAGNHGFVSGGSIWNAFRMA